MDTHAVIGKLQEEYGMAPKTAEAIVYAVQQGQENIRGLATKEDLAHVKDYLEGKDLVTKEDLARVKDRLEGRMDRLEGRMARLEERMESRMDRLAETVSNTARWIIGLFVGLAGLQIASIVFVISVLT